MKSVQHPIPILLTIFFLSITVQLHAVHSSKAQLIQEIHNEAQQKKQKKQGIIGKWMQKRLSKKIQTLAAKEKITKQANSSLIFGVSSFLALFLALLSPIFLLFAAILAILGDIFAITVLRKIKRNSVDTFHKEKIKARWGLVFSLLTGLLPLLLGLLVLVSI